MTSRNPAVCLSQYASPRYAAHASAYPARAVLLSLLPANALAQSSAAPITFDFSTKVFRLAAAVTTYVFGINESQQVQTLYWGHRLSRNDHFAPAKAIADSSSLDAPVTSTPQEFVGWGGGLFVEPDLKITFPNGNRDLVLHYISNQIAGDTLSILMKDISLEV